MIQIYLFTLTNVSAVSICPGVGGPLGQHTEDDAPAEQQVWGELVDVYDNGSQPSSGGERCCRLVVQQ